MIQRILISAVFAVSYFAFQPHASLFAEANKSERSNGLTATPCAAEAEHKQFDYWLGEWNVTSEGTKVAESSIQRIIEGCVIYENYSQANGFHGKSFNFYDSVLKKWRQTWVDSGGNVSEFTGQLKDGAMHYEGESHLKNGSRVLRRMIVYNLGPDRVRQYSERSTDDGKTWTVAYDFIYERKK